jgi:NADH:ubiquinone oxidoreductase subunit F (NADH-binding)
VAPVALAGRRVAPRVAEQDVGELPTATIAPWRGTVGPADADPAELAIHLAGEPDFSASAWDLARASEPSAVLQQIEQSGLQGRGGAGFPAHIKWSALRDQPETERYVVLNADEGEPGTFKDREILLRRPDLVIEGLAIAASVVGASEVYLYLRGEFEIAWKVVEQAIERFEGAFPGVTFHLHAGQGAYICGEETALLEALEGRRGMPRLKPPLPVHSGLWGKPTLIQNVETIACVPAIVRRGGLWFRELGRREAGTKLYCLSGHVARPGTYEMPLGVTLDELLAAAGGESGTLKAFSPGGASSGFLPARDRTQPLDFGNLSALGSMLGSAGVVVLDDTVDMAWAAREQLRFFEEESCGQCAPCRIGTRYLRESLDRHRQARGAGRERLAHVADVAWQMNEGSICGLGQAAPLPLTSALKHFPEDFDA